MEGRSHREIEDLDVLAAGDPELIELLHRNYRWLHVVGGGNRAHLLKRLWMASEGYTEEGKAQRRWRRIR